MKTLLRYMLKCMLERKLRTLLILTVIMLSSAMFFAAISLSGTLVKMQMENWRQSYGYADIIINRSQSAPSPFFHLNGALQYQRDMEYVIGEISGFGTYAKPEGGSTGVRLKGIDYDDLRRLTPLTVTDAKGLYPFAGMKAVISTQTAENFSLKTGDFIKLDINGNTHKFVISAIVRPAGPYSGENQSFLAVVPRSTLSSLYNVRGKVDMVYIKLLNPEKKQRYLYLLSQEYKRYTVMEPFTEWEIKKETDRIATPVIIVTVILSFMCVYIIHTTYKIIILERMPVIGTFRSIGGSRLSTNIILLLESLLYGLSGGICGCILGTGLLYAITSLSGMTAADSLGPVVNIRPINMAYTVAAALLLALSGSLLPVMQSMKLSVKEIIFGTIKEKNALSKSVFIPGTSILAGSLAIPLLMDYRQGLVIYTLCMPALLLAVCLLIPHALDMILSLLDKFIFLNASIRLAVKNLRRNRNAVSNISLLIIGISSLYMISTINTSQVLLIYQRFSRIHSDITLIMDRSDKASLAHISSLQGIQDALGCYYARRTEVQGKEDPIWHILSVNEKFSSFFEIKSPQGSGVLETLNTERSIILTEALGERLGVSPGDTLTLKFPTARGSHTLRQYMVTGFFDTINQGEWSYALISERNFQEDVRGGFYGKIFIKAENSPEKVQNMLKTEFAGRKPLIELTEDLRDLALEANRQLFLILQGYTVLTMVTGLYGILNNSAISFLQRKRQLAIYRSTGMSRPQLKVMMLTEAVIQGVTGSIAGIISGIAATWVIVPQIIKALSIESYLYFSRVPVLYCLTAAAISILPAVLEPLIQSSRLDLVKAIKCEQE